MKILILTNYSNGLWLFRKELLIAFLEQGHDVYVSLPPDENVKKLKDLQFSGKHINIIDTPFERRGNNPIKDFGLLMTYIKLLKKHKPDVVLTYTIKPNLYGGLACRFCKIPYICNITGLGTAIENGGLLSNILLKFYRISMKGANRVFFQNIRNKEFMNAHKVALKNSGILPGSGVNLITHPFEEYPSEKDGVNILAVIRIMKDKGIEEYLEAARILHEKNPKLMFWLVGEYEEETRDVYEPLISDMVKKGCLRYFGHIDNVNEVMAQSHIIVHPSYHEGLSNVLLEAAACARPVLAGKINGCIETFDEGNSGYAFDIKDTDAIVKAVEKIMTLSEEQRAQMGAYGRKWVEDRFDRNIIIEEYKKELKKIR